MWCSPANGPVGNFLVQEGRRVAVMEMLDSVAADVYSMVRIGLLEGLNQLKKLHIIGDAKQPRRIGDAIPEGCMATYEI